MELRYTYYRRKRLLARARRCKSGPPACALYNLRLENVFISGRACVPLIPIYLLLTVIARKFLCLFHRRRCLIPCSLILLRYISSGFFLGFFFVHTTSPDSCERVCVCGSCAYVNTGLRSMFNVRVILSFFFRL